MQVTAWRNGRFSNPRTVYGIRVGASNRAQYFPAGSEHIVVEMDGAVHSFRLTAGFWRKCPEFRDSGGTHIRDWLARHYSTDWSRGQPPQFELLPQGGNRFRLAGKEEYSKFLKKQP